MARKSSLLFRRSLKAAVDTDATYTMLPPDLLLDIGYDPASTTRRLELSTANGLVMVPVLRVRRLKCLGLTVTDVEGLLGLNVLVHFKPFQRFHQTLRPFTV